MKSFQLAVAVSGSLACLGALSACSGAPGTGSSTGSASEKTGMIVAAVTAPKDALCIELTVNDYNGNNGYYGPTTSFTDVTPGKNAVVQIGPLSPGYAYLTGDAYPVPCSQVEYPWEYGGSSSGPLSGGSSGAVYGGTSSGVIGSLDGGAVEIDAGVTNPTWEADETQVLVAPGAPTSATLDFHQFGSLNLNIDFQNCDPNSYYYQPWCYDGGGSSSGGSSSSSGGLGSSSGGSGSSSGAGSSSSSGGKLVDAGSGKSDSGRD